MSPLVKYLLRNLATRPFISLLVLGSMVVVGATVGAVSAVNAGLHEAFNVRGHENYVLVTSPYAKAETLSELPKSHIAVLSSKPGVQRVSPEVVQQNMVQTAAGSLELVPLRALERQGFDMHPFELIEGRMPAPGAPEFIVGDALRRHLPWITPGAKVKFMGIAFTCVGAFRTTGVYAGEAWTTRAAILAEPRLIPLSVIYLELPSRTDAVALADAITKDRSLPEQRAQGQTETDFYTKMMSVFSHISTALQLIFLLVVSGAVFAAAALLSLFQQRRLSELSVMRAIGFRSVAIATLIIYEIEILVIIGGGLGVLLVHLALRNYAVHVSGGDLITATFVAPLTWQLAVLSMGTMVFFGVVAAIIPIVRMVRTPITRGLREE